MLVKISDCGGLENNTSEKILQKSRGKYVTMPFFYVFLSMACQWRKFPVVAEASGCSESGEEGLYFYPLFLYIPLSLSVSLSPYGLS